MQKEINISDIKEFYKTSPNKPVNILKKKIIEIDNDFDIEIKSGKRYNQKSNARCWVYAGFNMILNNVAKNMDINILNLEFSSSYYAFYDYLERSNSTYQIIIDSKKNSIKDIRGLVSFSLETQGNFETFKYITNKYGIIPKSCMKESKLECDDKEFRWIFNNKIIDDIKKIMACKKNKNIDLYQLKKELLKENYDILCKAFGRPPISFSYDYFNTKNENINITMTPIEFKNKYLTLNLNDFIILENYPMYGRKYNNKYNYKNCKNVYYGVTHNFVTVKMSVIKEAVIKQMKDGISVYSLLYTNKMRNWKKGIIDLSIYDLKNLNTNISDKKSLINLNQIYFMHAMCLRGIKFKNQKPILWKFENTYGTKNNNGFITLTDEVFDLFVLSVVVDKKYLTEEIISIYNNGKVKDV